MSNLTKDEAIAAIRTIEERMVRDFQSLIEITTSAMEPVSIPQPTVQVIVDPRVPVLPPLIGNAERRDTVYAELVAAGETGISGETIAAATGIKRGTVGAILSSFKHMGFATHRKPMYFIKLIDLPEAPPADGTLFPRREGE